MASEEGYSDLIFSEIRMLESCIDQAITEMRSKPDSDSSIREDTCCDICIYHRICPTEILNGSQMSCQSYQKTDEYPEEFIMLRKKHILWNRDK